MNQPPRDKKGLLYWIILLGMCTRCGIRASETSPGGTLKTALPWTRSFKTSAQNSGHSLPLKLKKATVLSQIESALGMVTKSNGESDWRQDRPRS